MKSSIFQNSFILLLNYVMILKIKMNVFPSHVFPKSSLLENVLFIYFYVLYTTKPFRRLEAMYIAYCRINYLYCIVLFNKTSFSMNIIDLVCISES